MQSVLRFSRMFNCMPPDKQQHKALAPTGYESKLNCRMLLAVADECEDAMATQLEQVQVTQQQEDEVKAEVVPVDVVQEGEEV